MDTEKIKKAVANRALQHVKNNTIIGLGSGSTSNYFIEALAEKTHKESLNIRCCASSKQSEIFGLKLGLNVIPIDSIDTIDLYVDGADEVTPKKQLIKGLGGALLREKICAERSKQVIILIDESKLVPQLGKKVLPVEVIPFGHTLTAQKLLQYTQSIHLRMKNNIPFVSDNQNYIYDLQFSKEITDPTVVHNKLKAICGVVETGLFFDIADIVYIGYSDGRIEELQ